jgi:hypothetical protein
MRAGFPFSSTLVLALSTALLVPAVHWCAVPWEQTTLACVVRCSATSATSCQERDAPACDPISDVAASAACPLAGESSAMPCAAGGSCPLASHSSPGKHGRAYVLAEAPGGVVVRGLGKLIVDLSQLEAPLPSRNPVVVVARPIAPPPDPEFRPPCFAWTAVRLARAPPGA